MAKKLNARQQSLSLLEKLKAQAQGMAGKVGNIVSTSPVVRNVQGAISTVSNTRLVPNAPTIGQAARNTFGNPQAYLPYQLTNYPKTGNRAIDFTTQNVFKPTGQALKGFTDTGSFGLVNLPAAAAQGRLQQGARYAGNAVGFAGALLGTPGMALSKVGRGGEIAAKALVKKGAPTLVKKGVAAVGGELAQTGAFATAKALANQQFNPVEDLGYGVGLRGLGKLVGKTMGPVAKNAKNQYEYIAKKDKEDIIKAMHRILQRSEDASYYVTRRGNDEKFLRQMAQDYIGKSFAKKAKLQDIAQELDNRIRDEAGDKLLDLPQMNFLGDQSGFSNFREIGNIGNVKPQGATLQDTQSYLNQLKRDQTRAKSTGAGGIINKGQSIYKDLKARMIDSASPIEDALNDAEKKGKFKVRPTGDVRLQIDRVLRSKPLAAQFAEDNGLSQVIKDAPDLDALDQYMIAKQAKRVAKEGIKTGRDAVRDDLLIEELAPQYEEHAKQVNEYSRRLLAYSVSTGLIDEKLARDLVQKYPEYVPLNRVFNELEKTQYQGSTKAIASLSKQTVVQKLKGSEREIASPVESLLLKTQTAFEQGEKNKAAKMVASYKDLPGFENLLRELKPDEKATHTISYLDKGVKRTFETSPELAAAAKNLNQEQMNIILKVLSVPTRALQLGATGLNVPFVATNLLKDQITSFINSNKAARTSIANPVNFARALYSAVGHDDLYKEVVRNAAGGTSFDISRQAPDLSVKAIRANRNLGSKIAYTATNPGQILRSLENLVGRGEEVTRIQQYKGTLDALIKEGRTLQDAKLLAAKAARENTANFARKGDIGKVINYVIPFFNAGIQGSRALVRSMQRRPIETGSKLAVAVFTPVAATTMWNLTDPARKAVYDDIDQFEKDNNIVIIPDNATKNGKDQWNVIKIPLPPGLSNLGSVVRRTVEQTHGLDPVKFGEVATNVIAAATSVDLSSPSKVFSSVIPQAVKPFVETTTNTNLFTGRDIVPQSMKDLPPYEQVRPYTSGTARIVGNITNQSPLKVENFARTAFGGLGSQVMNAADTGLNKLGLIPEEQIGGESAIGNIQRRFSQASGGQLQNKEFEQVNALKQDVAVENAQQRRESQRIVDLVKQAKSVEERQQVLLQNVKTEEQLDQIISIMKDEGAGVQAIDRSVRALPINKRAEYIRGKLRGKSQQEISSTLLDLANKGILTEKVLDELLNQAIAQQR